MNLKIYITTSDLQEFNRFMADIEQFSQFISYENIVWQIDRSIALSHARAYITDDQAFEFIDFYFDRRPAFEQDMDLYELQLFDSIYSETDQFYYVISKLLEFSLIRHDVDFRIIRRN